MIARGEATRRAVAAAGGAAVLILLLAAALAGLAALDPDGSPPSAEAASGACERAVVRDWSLDGRVDGVYSLACYRRALAQLPSDMRDYSDAPDEIERALAVASNRRLAMPKTTPKRAGSQTDQAPPLTFIAIGIAALLAGLTALPLLTRRRRRPAS